ncbi:MAG: ribonucrease [Chloroflexota bacterium]|jgi:ribonuclease Y|nr:ribonucrease [Chloroflexota bacterium]
MELVIVILVGLIAVGVGLGAGVLLGQRGYGGRAAQAETAAAKLLADAEANKKELLLEAKEESMKLRAAIENEARQQRGELKTEQNRLRQKEENLDRKVEVLEQRERRMATREQEIEARAKEVDELRASEVHELELLAQMTRDEARGSLITRLESEMREEAGRRARHIVEDARRDANEEARRLVTLAVQRIAGEHVGETTVSVVPIPNEEMKGRIIGREGRNIRALEAATGVDLIIDETPDAVMISGFDPVRREIARLSLSRLVQDGRIHPARIEEVVAKATQEVEEGMLRAGEEAALAAGVHGLHAEILKVFGRMKYRTSYGQNQLAHSVEVSQIARILANELGADPEVAARGALLHDIGKVMGHEVDGPHHVIGADFVRRFGESGKVADAIVEHHDSDPELVGLEAVIVQAADAISGARPGARHESVENYIKRLESLEQIANSFMGVEKSFAIQAGREVRIVVKPDEIDDLGSIRLARDIAKKIEENLQYPGQVKVTVVRETRAFEIAH